MMIVDCEAEFSRVKDSQSLSQRSLSTSQSATRQTGLQVTFFYPLQAPFKRYYPPGSGGRPRTQQPSAMHRCVRTVSSSTHPPTPLTVGALYVSIRLSLRCRSPPSPLPSPTELPTPPSSTPELHTSLSTRFPSPPSSLGLSPRCETSLRLLFRRRPLRFPATTEAAYASPFAKRSRNPVQIAFSESVKFSCAANYDPFCRSYCFS
jgi:hypothetical protein